MKRPADYYQSKFKHVKITSYDQVGRCDGLHRYDFYRLACLNAWYLDLALGQCYPNGLSFHAY